MSDAPQHGHGHGQTGQDPLSDRMVTPERSVFGTRLPRPTGVGRHLLVVIVLSVVALVIAVFFAERDAGAEADAEPKTFKAEAP